MPQGKRKIEQEKKAVREDRIIQRAVKDMAVRYQGKGGPAGGNGQKTDGRKLCSTGPGP